MVDFDTAKCMFSGPQGTLRVPVDDEITRKLAMLIDGECMGPGPKQAAEKYGFSRQRYFQLRTAFREHGALGLVSQRRGPKTHYRRSKEVVCQAIRHRFLDPDASSAVIVQKLRQCGFEISKRSIDRIFNDYGLQKKKLFKYRPDREPLMIETQRTQKTVRSEPAHPTAIERHVRQLLADKISGNMVGLWLLVPEHLRLGTWDLLCRWTACPPHHVQPRLALQVVHEAALCVPGVRQQRSLSQKGFEVVNGLPFIATDQAIHDLLQAHTVAEAETLQLELGLLRRAHEHYVGRLLAIDPHRLHSYTQRQTIRYRGDEASKPYKVAQTFFCLDTATKQPLCFTTATAAMSVTQATPSLLRLASDILGAPPRQSLVVADTEHYTAHLIDHVYTQTPFDLLVPMPNHKSLQQQMRALPQEVFTRHWAGFATTHLPYQLASGKTGPHWQFIQRCGERAGDYTFKAFLSTREDDEVAALTRAFPKRWHVEEFFNANQALGWKRAGTMNLHIRYGQMTLALVAQAIIHQFRRRLGEPYDVWDAHHLAQHVFNGLDGDIRVSHDTIVVTFYNAPNAEQLREHYEHLPEKLCKENIDPRIPWLYNLQLDFRFK